MGKRIVVCGGNGAGKSTLGQCLALNLNFKYMDIEDYYFFRKNDYSSARTREEVCNLLVNDFEYYEDCVLSAVKADYGTRLESLIDVVVFIDAPKSVRMERVRARSFSKFGERILPGGDLYEIENAFFDMVIKRSDRLIQDWFKTLSVPILTVDGTKPIEDNVRAIMEYIQQMPAS